MPFIKSDTEHEDPMNMSLWSLPGMGGFVRTHGATTYECCYVGQAKIETSMTRSKVKMEA